MNFLLARCSCAILVVASLLIIVGCTPPPGTATSSPVERYVKSGQAQAKRNDFAGALAAFNQALALDLNNAAVHYELAGLYENDLNFPEKALYHYTRVLEINPEYRWADIIKDRLPELRMRVSSGNIPMVPCSELEEQIVELHRTLAQKNAELQQQADLNNELRQSIRIGQASRGQPAQQPVVTQTRSTPRQTPPTSLPRSEDRQITSSTSQTQTQPPSQSPLRYTPPSQIRHTVVRGDTLYSLAKRHGIQVQDIVQANPGLVPEDIKIGHMIIIPTR